MRGARKDGGWGPRGPGWGNLKRDGRRDLCPTGVRVRGNAASSALYPKSNQCLTVRVAKTWEGGSQCGPLTLQRTPLECRHDNLNVHTTCHFSDKILLCTQPIHPTSRVPGSSRPTSRGGTRGSPSPGQGPRMNREAGGPTLLPKEERVQSGFQVPPQPHRPRVAVLEGHFHPPRKRIGTTDCPADPYVVTDRRPGQQAVTRKGEGGLSRGFCLLDPKCIVPLLAPERH